MQCMNCGFENMPGLEACSRCDSALALGEISVVPARASTLRLRTRIHQLRNRVAVVLTYPFRIRIPRWVPRSKSPILWPTLARTVVPGLGHLQIGQRTTGWIFLLTWLGFLVAGLLTLPSQATVWLFSAAVATHASAMISVFSADLSFQRPVIRMLFGILLFIALRQLVYVPIGMAAELFWVPMVVPSNLLPGTVTQSGEGLVYEGRWLRPDQFERGDLIFYRIRAINGHGYYSLEGHGLDRIVGIPGDNVVVKDGILLVNGETPSANEMPIGSVERMPDISIDVKDGQYAVLPTRLSFHAHNASVYDAIVRGVLLTTDEFILGRIRFRLQPWSRFGRIE
ncbi:MAG: hypothetical protein MI923_12260 [Phycisphaerales bacterium]|nr:hypothetical protein [Phycisphaerales bacterium]